MHGALDIPRELEPINEVIADALDRVRARLDDQLASPLLSVTDLVAHVERYRGKMLRPALVLLSGMAAGPSAPYPERITSDHVTIAAVCEMVHLATLVHDDVLDEADVRRREPTINRLRGNEAAVILGDYLIAAAYHLCSTLQDQRTALTIGRVSMDMCAGELLQLSNRQNLSLDRATYTAIVERKTAALIAAACELGANHSGADRVRSRALRDYGRAVGVAFQIQDDLLDLTGHQDRVGKSLGKDLEKGKLTLPVILHLADATAADRARSLDLLDAASAGDPDAAAGLGAVLESSGALDAARAEAKSWVAAATTALDQLPDDLPKTYLKLLADAVITRGF